MGQTIGNFHLIITGIEEKSKTLWKIQTIIEEFFYKKSTFTITLIKVCGISIFLDKDFYFDVRKVIAPI